jgi:hypothetical protein
MHYLTMHISGIDGDSLVDRALGYTTYSETTSTMAVSVNEAESGGVGGWHTGGLRGTLTCCKSDSDTLGLENGNPEEIPRFPWGCNTTIPRKYINDLHTYE